MEVQVKVLKYPHPSLNKVCVEVKVFGPELDVILNTMFDTMIEHKGIGLAANQVGLHYRMFTMLGPNGERLFLVNPKIVKRSFTQAMLKEGCLSAPGEFLILEERSQWVEVEFQDEKGKSKTKRFQGIHAVCVQHETDHLDGKTHLQSKSLSREERRRLKQKWGLK